MFSLFMSLLSMLRNLFMSLPESVQEGAIKLAVGAFEHIFRTFFRQEKEQRSSQEPAS